MDKKHILRIVKGEGTEEERKLFFEQLASDQELADEYSKVKNSFTINSLPNTPDPRSFLKPKTKRLKLFTIITRVAAVLFIPLMGYFTYNVLTNTKIDDTPSIYRFGTGVQYVVNPGIKASLTLPDSTRVWLNSESYLNIPTDFSEDNRIVMLSGEGYFEVKSNQHSPFIINTHANIKVKVTGTKFNLSCYENDPNMKISLLNGSLDLIKNDKEIIAVKPQEQVIIEYSSLKDLHEPEADIDYAIAWKEGFLRFNNTPMDEVLRKLERWFGVDITVQDSRILKHLFTADFESESLTQVLELMKITANIHYEILESNKVKLYTLTKGYIYSK